MSPSIPTKVMVHVCSPLAPAAEATTETELGAMPQPISMAAPAAAPLALKAKGAHGCPR